MRRDYEFVVNLFYGFFQQKRIQNTLNLMFENEITAWETWFQIEFSYYLHTNKKANISEWDREVLYSTDKRRTNQKLMYVDFVVRQKGSKKEEFIAVEVKQDLCHRNCIRKMLQDVDKFDTMKHSEDDIRSFWCLGIHQRVENKNEVYNLIEGYNDGDYSLRYYETKFIPRTNFAFTVF